MEKSVINKEEFFTHLIGGRLNNIIGASLKVGREDIHLLGKELASLSEKDKALQDGGEIIENLYKLAQGLDTSDKWGSILKRDILSVKEKYENIDKIIAEENIMEKQKYCVVVVTFDNGVKKPTEVMPIQMAKEWVKRFAGKPEQYEVIETTSNGEHIGKIDIEKFLLGGGVDVIEKPSGAYMFPENPTEKSKGVKMVLGGNIESIKTNLKNFIASLPSVEDMSNFVLGYGGLEYEDFDQWFGDNFNYHLTKEEVKPLFDNWVDGLSEEGLEVLLWAMKNPKGEYKDVDLNTTEVGIEQNESDNYYDDRGYEEEHRFSQYDEAERASFEEYQHQKYIDKEAEKEAEKRFSTELERSGFKHGWRYIYHDTNEFTQDREPIEKTKEWAIDQARWIEVPKKPSFRETIFNKKEWENYKAKLKEREDYINAFVAGAQFVDPRGELTKLNEYRSQFGVGGTMDSSNDADAPVLGGTMGSSMRMGGKVKQYDDLSKEKPQVVNDTEATATIPEIDIALIDKTEFDGKENKIHSSVNANNVFRKIWDMRKIDVQEEMNVLFLNKSNAVIGYYRHSMGGIDGTILDKQLICGLAVKSLAKGVIIAHNHPSGNLNPSEQDIRITRELDSALRLFNINLLDSLIVTKGGYYSLKDEEKFKCGGTMRTGGNIDEHIVDLFEHYDELPTKVQQVLDKYNEDDEATYDNLGAMQQELEALGYTFDWGLGAEPMNLRRMKSGGNLEPSSEDFKQMALKYKAEFDKFMGLYLDYSEKGETLKAQQYKKLAHEAYKNEEKARQMWGDTLRKMMAGGKPDDWKKALTHEEFVKLAKEKGCKNIDEALATLGYRYDGLKYVDARNEPYKKQKYANGANIGVNKKYTHFAVRKSDGKIVNGWETVSDVESLKYYAKQDLLDMDLNPKDYKILSKEHLIRNGVNPFDWNSWLKTGEMKTGGNIEEEVTNDNFSKYKTLAPNGYTFSKKKLTQMAKKRLAGYWLQLANANEKKREMEADRASGKQVTNHDYEWLQKYQNGQHACFIYLKQNGFLKKALREGGNLKGANDAQAKINELKAQKSAIMRGDGLPNRVTRMIDGKIKILEEDVKRFGGGGTTKKKDENDVSQYYESYYERGAFIPNQKQKEVITKKIGLSEVNADYLVGFSPKFAIWLGDTIVRDYSNKEYNSFLERKDYRELFNEEKVFNQNDYFNKDGKASALSALNSDGVPTKLVRKYQQDIRLILDWIQHPLTPKQNLRELSFQDAVEKAKKWHDELQTLGGDVDYDEPEENLILKRYPKTPEDVTYYWVQIPKSFCDVESKRMGHCGRTGASDLISLRSITPYGKGHTLTDSHVTIAWDEDEALFYQIKGKKNQKPTKKYHEYIFDIVKGFAESEKFTGFGVEYDPKEDYSFEDMSKEQVAEIYDINPEIFNGFEGEVVLYENGLREEKPNTIVEITKDAEYVSDLLNVDRNIDDKFIKQVLSGDMHEFFDGNWSYYYQNYESLVNDLNKENEAMVVKEIMRLTKYPKKKVVENGITYYLTGQDEKFDSDVFENIVKALVNAMVSAEEADAYSHYTKEIEKALIEIGTVEKLNYDGVVLKVDLADHLTYRQIGAYIKGLNKNYLDNDSMLTDVFFEAMEDGEIEEPYFSIDERWMPSPSDRDFNAFFKEANLQEGYKLGGKLKDSDIQKLYDYLVENYGKYDKFSINEVKGRTGVYRIRVKDVGFFTTWVENAEYTTVTKELQAKFPELDVQAEYRLGNDYDPPKTSSIVVKEKQKLRMGGTTKTKEVHWTKRPIIYGYVENNDLNSPRTFSVLSYGLEHLLKHKNIEVLSTDRRVQRGIMVYETDLFYAWDKNKQKDGVLYFGKLNGGNFPKEYKGKIIYKDGGNITKNEVLQQKIGKVMHEFKHKQLRTPQGKLVTNPKQAIAIGYSEGRASWKKKMEK